MPLERVALPVAVFINARQLQETFIWPIALRMGTYGVSISADVKGKGMANYGYVRVSTRGRGSCVSSRVAPSGSYPTREPDLLARHQVRPLVPGRFCFDAQRVSRGGADRFRPHHSCQRKVHDAAIWRHPDSLASYMQWPNELRSRWFPQLEREKQHNI